MYICIGIYFNFDEEVLTFGIVLKMRTVKHKYIIKKILCKAIDENKIEQKLKEINEVRIKYIVFKYYQI